MADLARSAVVFNDEYSNGRNKRFFVRDITMTLTGQGGITNRILASTLEFLKITAWTPWLRRITPPFILSPIK
jgi:hypothetical protein